MTSPVRPLAGASALVTGGTGFIGSHLVRALTERGAVPTAIGRRGGRGQGGPETIPIDLSTESIEDLLRTRRFRYVFHLAGSSSVPRSFDRPDEDLAANTGAAVRLLDAVRRSGTDPLVVLASSAAVYGHPQRLPMREDDPPAPISPYGCSKLAAERYLAAFARDGVRGATLRIFSAYGPGLRRQVVFDVLDRVRHHQTHVELAGDPTDSRDFLFVSDVVEAALVVAMASPGRGEAYNVGSGTETTMEALVRLIADVTGSTPSFRFTGRVGPGTPRRWQAEVSRLRSLGWEQHVNLEEGLRRTARWVGATAPAAASPPRATPAR